MGEKVDQTNFNVLTLSANVGDLSSIPGSRRSHGDGNGNLLQYSCLENPMDGACTVHAVLWLVAQLCCAVLSHSVVSDSLRPHGL